MKITTLNNIIKIWWYIWSVGSIILSILTLLFFLKIIPFNIVETKIIPISMCSASNLKIGDEVYVKKGQIWKVYDVNLYEYLGTANITIKKKDGLESSWGE